MQTFKRLVKIVHSEIKWIDPNSFLEAEGRKDALPFHCLQQRSQRQESLPERCHFWPQVLDLMDLRHRGASTTKSEAITGGSCGSLDVFGCTLRACAAHLSICEDWHAHCSASGVQPAKGSCVSSSETQVLCWGPEEGALCSAQPPALLWALVANISIPAPSARAGSLPSASLWFFLLSGSS